MSAAKERLPTALRAVCQPLPESNLSIFEEARSCLVLRITTAIEQGYVIEVSQRINPLAPREAVTVASVRRARGNY